MTITRTEQRQNVGGGGVIAGQQPSTASHCRHRGRLSGTAHLLPADLPSPIRLRKPSSTFCCVAPGSVQGAAFHVQSATLSKQACAAKGGGARCTRETDPGHCPMTSILVRMTTDAHPYVCAWPTSSPPRRARMARCLRLRGDRIFRAPMQLCRRRKCDWVGWVGPRLDCQQFRAMRGNLIRRRHLSFHQNSNPPFFT